MAWHGSDPHAAFSHPENNDAPSALHSVTIPNVNLPKVSSSEGLDGYWERVLIRCE